MALREWVYADESGIHDGARFCVVAGYRGSSKQWEDFNRKWRAVLRRPGYDIRDAFHSKVFFNRKVIPRENNPYFGWSEEKAAQFLGELHTLIGRYRFRPVGCAVNVQDFESYSYGERCVLVGYTPQKARRQHRSRPTPYHLAVHHMVVDAVVDTRSDTELHFVLAKQRELQQRGYDGYLLTKELGMEGRANQLKGMGFEPCEDFPGLQVADLFVRQWYNALVRGGAQSMNRENIKSMNQLTRRRKDIPLVDAASIERMFAEIGMTPEDRRQLQSISEPS